MVYTINVKKMSMPMNNPYSSTKNWLINFKCNIITEGNIITEEEEDQKQQQKIRVERAKPELPRNRCSLLIPLCNRI